MKVYAGRTGGISDCLNRLLQEVLGCVPAIILMIFFCKVEILPLLEKLVPENYSVFYKWMKVCIVQEQCPT